MSKILQQEKFKNISLFWGIPLLLAFVFQLLFASRIDLTSLILLQYLVFILILHLTISVFKNTKLKQIVHILVYSIFVLSLTIESIYLSWFASVFSPSSLFILLETNVAEAFEFLTFYTQWNVLIFIFLMLLVLVVGIFNLKKSKFFFLHLKTTYTFVALLSLLLLLKFSTLINYNFAYLFGRGVVVYNYERLQQANLNIDSPLGNFSSVELTSPEKPKTFVLVIGESTQQHHLQLYGYERETTPNFSSIKDELLVFEDVVSTNVYTIGALKTALTYNDLEGDNETTIVQMMNQAGFKTFWLSNQRPVGPYESLVTKMAKASDKFIFTNAELAGAKTPYDEVLIPHFQNALKDEAPHKFIVLHLLGTHLKYYNRYPKEQDFFANQTIEGKSEEAMRFINEYDNAIRYQDEVLFNLLSELKKQEEETYFLYFSDHGEEVFSTSDFAGHNEEKPTPAMYEIPFVLWHSQPKEEWENYLSRKYSTRHLIHTVADLSGIEFDEIEPKKSIFSEEFEEIPRIISKNRNYDEWVNDN